MFLLADIKIDHWISGVMEITFDQFFFHSHVVSLIDRPSRY